MPTVPNEIDPLPTPPPSSDDPTNFDTRADALMAALPDMATQVNQAAQATYNNAVEVAASTVAAAASATAAAAASGAAAWNPATSYATDAAAISPTDSQTYRRLAPGGVDATDPALSEDWVILGGVPLVGGVLTGAARMPAGNNAQRPTPQLGYTRINTESAAGLRFMEFWDGVQWVPVGRTNAVPMTVTAANQFDVDAVPAHVKRVELLIYDFVIASTTDQALYLYVSDDGAIGSGYMNRNRIRGVESEFLASTNVADEQDQATAGIGGAIVLIPEGVGGAGILNGKVTLTRTADPSEWLYEFSLAKTGTVRQLIGAGRFEIVGTAVLGRLRLLYTYSVSPGRAEVTYEF